jgi:transposase InsO family protein
MLTIVDTFSRYSPAVEVRFSYRGEDVVQTLERVCCEAGYPKAIRVDQGSSPLHDNKDPAQRFCIDIALDSNTSAAAMLDRHHAILLADPIG